MTPTQFKRRRAKLFPAPTQQASRKLAATTLGVHINTIAHWEYGERKVPESAVKLLECLEREKKAGGAKKVT